MPVMTPVYTLSIVRVDETHYKAVVRAVVGGNPVIVESDPFTNAEGLDSTIEDIQLSAGVLPPP